MQTWVARHAFLKARSTGPGSDGSRSLGVLIMNIRFISSLTPEDEDRIAPGLLGAVGPLLDALPLAYTIRIETSNGKIFQHAHTGPEVGEQGSEVDSVPQRAVAGLFRTRGPAS